jgi:DnaJ-class molecular chaperone
MRTCSSCHGAGVRVEPVPPNYDQDATRPLRVLVHTPAGKFWEYLPTTLCQHCKGTGEEPENGPHEELNVGREQI